MAAKRASDVDVDGTVDAEEEEEDVDGLDLDESFLDESFLDLVCEGGAIVASLSAAYCLGCWPESSA